MGRACMVCTHPERGAIDHALASGLGFQAISRQWKVGSESVRRHHNNHLSPALAALEAKREEEVNATLVARIETLIRRADELYKVTAKEGKVTSALAALREMRGSLELLGKATGELDDRPQVTVNLMASPEWLAVRDVILSALMSYPEARAQVSGRLLELEAGS